jgi:hypothetical protein
LAPGAIVRLRHRLKFQVNLLFLGGNVSLQLRQHTDLSQELCHRDFGLLKADPLGVDFIDDCPDLPKDCLALTVNGGILPILLNKPITKYSGGHIGRSQPVPLYDKGKRKEESSDACCASCQPLNGCATE